MAQSLSTYLARDALRALFSWVIQLWGFGHDTYQIFFLFLYNQYSSDLLYFDTIVQRCGKIAKSRKFDLYFWQRWIKNYHDHAYEYLKLINMITSSKIAEISFGFSELIE